MIDFNQMTKEERVVYAAIKDARIGNLKPRKDIEKSTGLTKRRIEKIIVRLRNKQNINVFALKEYPRSGYYLATNEEDRHAGTHAYRSQIRTSMKNLAIMDNLPLDEYWESVS